MVQKTKGEMTEEEHTLQDSTKGKGRSGQDFAAADHKDFRIWGGVEEGSERCT